jgi:predicted phage terminase large subunit-like protein
LSFKLTAKQQIAGDLLGSTAMHQLYYGGSRSGKSFVILRAIVIRALKVCSRHVALRFRFNACKESLGMDTFPKLMRLAFPDSAYELNKGDWFARFPWTDSELWFGGLDDKDRTEKILGKEYASMFFNECSQIPFGSVELSWSRLAQKTGLQLRAYYDENPPLKGHWTYKLFFLKKDPITGQTRADGENFRYLQMLPEDNAENIAPEAINILKAMSGARRKRFYLGEFGEDNPDALFSSATFDKYRVLTEELPDMQRVVVAIDPSGSDEEEHHEHDAIGIVVMGLGTNGNAYLLEDLTLKSGPAAWGKVATDAYERHSADCVIAETNFGGAMVKHVIQSARPNTPFREAKASRGKVVRAEPISSLVEQGKIRHVGYFPELEDELTAFTRHGYTGGASPNRADAYVWAASSLFPGIARNATRETKVDYQKGLPLAAQGPFGFLSS